MYPFRITQREASGRGLETLKLKRWAGRTGAKPRYTEFMTHAERIEVLERETAASKERMDHAEKLLIQVIEANNQTAQTVGLLAGKMDRFVDADEPAPFGPPLSNRLT
jgi:hypothetical protein